MIDCSHDNSSKDYTRQPIVCREVLAQLDASRGAIMGLLLESNLQPGRQDWEAGTTLRYGVSITDACIGWDETETLLGEIAAADPHRRPRAVEAHATAVEPRSSCHRQMAQRREPSRSAFTALSWRRLSFIARTWSATRSRSASAVSSSGCETVASARCS